MFKWQPPQYNWNSIESGVKHHKTNQINQMTKYGPFPTSLIEIFMGELHLGQMISVSIVSYGPNPQFFWGFKPILFLVLNVHFFYPKIYVVWLKCKWPIVIIWQVLKIIFLSILFFVCTLSAIKNNKLVFILCLFFKYFNSFF